MQRMRLLAGDSLGVEVGLRVRRIADDDVKLVSFVVRYERDSAGVPCFCYALAGNRKSPIQNPPDTVPADCRARLPSAGISKPFCLFEPVIVSAEKCSLGK